MNYVWRPNGFLKSGDAQEIGSSLEEIRRLHGGRLTPEMVVSAAEDVNSPLHYVFDWNDEEAAHKYRMWQARALIKSVRIVHKPGTETVAFVNVRHESGSYYQRTDIAIRNITEWEQVLKAAKSKLESAHQSLVELEQIVVDEKRPAIRKARKTIGKGKDMLDAAA